jgi:cell division protein FtsI (penicillin-binding protein 3)
MTAPARTTATRSSTKERERDAATETTRTRSVSGTATRTRSAAAERAYARREERRDRGDQDARKRRVAAERDLQRARLPKTLLQSKVVTSRGPFVVGAMSLLASGLVATLWLATATVSGSYELQNADAELNSLQERKETLMREVSSLDSTPALERRAAQLGMVPAPEPAHLKVNPDRSVTVVGDPQPVRGAQPAPPHSAPTPPAPDSSADLHRQAAPVPAVEGR